MEKRGVMEEGQGKEKRGVKEGQGKERRGVKEGQGKERRRGEGGRTGGRRGGGRRKPCNCVCRSPWQRVLSNGGHVSIWFKPGEEEGEGQRKEW